APFARGSGSPHEARRTARGLTLVDPALRRGLREALLGEHEAIECVVGGGIDGLTRTLDTRLQLRANRLIPAAAHFVGAVGVDLALDVRHVRPARIPPASTGALRNRIRVAGRRECAS